MKRVLLILLSGLLLINLAYAGENIPTDCEHRYYLFVDEAKESTTLVLGDGLQLKCMIVQGSCDNCGDQKTFYELEEALNEENFELKWSADAANCQHEYLHVIPTNVETVLLLQDSVGHEHGYTHAGLCIHCGNRERAVLSLGKEPHTYHLSGDAHLAYQNRHEFTYACAKCTNRMTYTEFCMGVWQDCRYSRGELELPMPETYTSPDDL